MIDRNGRHRCRRWQLNAQGLKARIGNVVPHRKQNHRANVCGRWLQEIAKEIEIILYVAQRSGAGYKAKQSRHAIDEFEISAVIVLAFA